MSPICIIGSGLASYHLAREIRAINPTIGITLVTQTDGMYYSKNQITYALGQQVRVSVKTLSCQMMADNLNLEIHAFSQVTQINTDKNSIVLHDGTEINYTKLVLACGARSLTPKLNFPPDIPHYPLNDLQAGIRLNIALRYKRHVTILGAGMMGCEIANQLCRQGYDITLIDQCSHALGTYVPGPIGTLVTQRLQALGVQCQLNCQIIAYRRNQQSLSLKLSNLSSFDTDLLIVTMGIKPITDLACQAGLRTNHGIVVNEYLETSAKDIYAIGDCAEVVGTVSHNIRFINACSKTLAQTLCGTASPLYYPAEQITLKTPDLPLVISRPPSHVVQNWQYQVSDDDAKAYCFDDNRELIGFILCGKHVPLRVPLSAAMNLLHP